MTDQCAAVDSFRLDRTSPVPVFQQIAQYIRAEIWQGRWGPGHNLPPEIELATRLGVARDTVRQAIQQLVREGLLRRQRGRGTRVVSTGAHLTNSTASDTTPSARHANPIEQPAATQNAPSITPEELTPLAQTLHALWSEFWQTAQRTGEQETTQLRRLSRWGKEMQALQLQFGAQLEQMQDLLSDLHSRLSPLEQSPAVEQAEGRRDLLLADAVKSLTRRATGKMAARPADLDELARAIYHETRQAVDATGFILALYDDESQTVEVVKQFDSDTELPGGSFPLGNGFTSEVIRTRRPRLIRHWSVEGPPIKIQYATDRQGLPESGITVPLLLGDRVLGALSVQSYQPNVYSDDDLLALQVIAVQAAVAVESLRRSTRLTAQLQRRLSEYETILESMADALLIVDGDGSVVRLTRAARKLLCLDNTSIILGQPLDESRWGQGSLGSPAVAEALRPLVEALRRGETLRDIEIELPGPTRRVLCLSCAPVPGATGAPASGVIVFRDVTERWEAKRNEEKVLAIVSQELRTPLSHIKEQIEALACQAESADALRGAAVVQHATAILEELGHAEVLLDLVSRWQAQAYRFKRRGTPRDLCETAPDEGNGLFEGQSKLDGRLLRGSHAGHATVDTGAHPIPVGREMGGER